MIVFGHWTSISKRYVQENFGNCILISQIQLSDSRNHKSKSNMSCGYNDVTLTREYDDKKKSCSLSLCIYVWVGYIIRLYLHHSTLNLIEIRNLFCGINTTHTHMYCINSWWKTSSSFSSSSSSSPPHLYR